MTITIPMNNKIFASVFITVLVSLAGTAFVNGDDGYDNVLRIDGSSTGGESGSSSWDSGRWYVQVDGVMGGKSSGVMEFIETNFDNSDSYTELLKFTGDISLDGGGFSSVRRPISLDLSNYDGIIVTLEADSYIYDNQDSSSSPTGIHLQLGDSSSYYDFSSAFAIPLASSLESSSLSESTSTLTSVYLPMNSFNRGTRMGFSCRSNDCKLDNTKINNLSIYVLFQEGSFDVRIKSISAVPKNGNDVEGGGGGPRSFLSPQIHFESIEEIINLLQSTIASGSSLYNMSYIELCVAMYWSVLNSILNALSESESTEEDVVVVVPTSTKVVICAGLNEMVMSLNNEDNNDNSSKQYQAFVLRYTIDAIIADLQGFDRSTNGDQYLPSLADAQSMDAVTTCVGRTSPTEGTLYDSYGNIIAVVDDDSEKEIDSNPEKETLLENDGIDLLNDASDGGTSSSITSTSSTDLVVEDEETSKEINDGPPTTTDASTVDGNAECTTLKDLACNTEGYSSICTLLKDRTLPDFTNGWAPTDTAFQVAILDKLTDEQKEEFLAFHFTNEDVSFKCGEKVLMTNGQDTRLLCDDENDEPIYLKGNSNSRVDLPQFDPEAGIPTCGGGTIYLIDQVLVSKDYFINLSNEVVLNEGQGEEVVLDVNDVAVQKSVSVSDSISASSSSTSSASASINTTSSYWTALILLSIVELIDFQLACM